MVAKSFLGVVPTLLFLSSSAFTQPKGLSESAASSTWVLGANTDSVTMCVAYELPYRKIIFTKSNDSPSRFSAQLSFSVDALDSVRGINHRCSARKDVTARSFDETRSDSRRAADFVTVTLPRSVYNINMELRDDPQKISYLNTVVRKHFLPRDSSEVLSVIFLDSLSGENYYPAISNDVAPFPHRIRLLVLSKAKTTLSASLSNKSLERPEVTCEVPLTFAGDRLQPLRGVDGFFMSDSKDSSGAFYLGVIPIDTLTEGNFELKLSQAGRTTVYPFKYLWLDKPSSLRDATMALSLLKYIIPDSLYAEITSGSDKEIEEKFDSFWKAHDPTPGTAFNELEAEYYERADYAFEQFRSIGTRNGAATDRGKAYILFGKPESVKREYRSDGTYEIWNYPNLKRSLVFREKGAGDFMLYQTEKL